MGIYDQGFWLVSRGGQSFVTVRGLEFWGHHVNLVALLFAPFYWLGAGPSFLYVAQAFALGLGALPVYLIARDRFERPWVGVAFAAAYLMYAPIQWITSANFHPEALVVTPFLFAWYFARRRSWGWYFVAVVLALSTREDTALAVFVLGIVLLVLYRRSDDRRDRHVALITMALGVVWYVVCTQLVIPYFNDGRQPFYLEAFYGSYGGSFPEIAANIVRHPGHVVGDATQPGPTALLSRPGVAVRRIAPRRAARAVDGGPADAGERDRSESVCTDDPLPVHRRDDRTHRDRRDRRRALALAIPDRPIPVGPVAARMGVLDQRRVVAVSRRCRLFDLGHRRTLGSRRFEQPSPWCPTTPLSRRPTRCCHTLPTASRSTTGRTRSRPRTGATTTATGCRTRRRSTTSSSIASRSAPDQQARFADLVDGDPFKIVFDRDDVVVAKRVVRRS